MWEKVVRVSGERGESGGEWVWVESGCGWRVGRVRGGESER